MGKRISEWIAERTDTGSNLLVEDVLFRDDTETVLRALAPEMDGIIVVATNTPGSDFVETYEDVTGRPEGIRVIDASGSGPVSSSSDGRVVYVSSPEELTTIGVKISESLEECADEEDVAFCFDSVSSPLTMMGTEDVFKFLHVVTGRIRSAGGVGVFGIRPEVHDKQELATVQQLFDGRFVTEGDEIVFRRGGFTG